MRLWEGKKEEKERKGRAHQRRVTFVIRKAIDRITTSIDKSG